MGDWNSGPTYSLGPISAAQGSPIGGLLAWAQGVSSDFAAGNAVATASPGTAAGVILGQPVPASQVANAYYTGMAANNGIGVIGGVAQTVGNVFGIGIATIGGGAGIAGKAASGGVASGASGAVTGATSVVSAGATGALSGIVPGLSSGVSSGLTSLSQTTGQSPDNLLILIGGGLVLVVLYMALT